MNPFVNDTDSVLSNSHRMVMAGETEAERVIAWRRERLIDAGWPEEYAQDLAKDTAVDLHEAMTLLCRGCAPETAWGILSSSDTATA